MPNPPRPIGCWGATCWRWGRLLGRAGNELVQGGEQVVDLHLLILDVKRDLLEVEQPFLGVCIAAVGCALKLLRELLYRLGGVLELGLQLLVLLVNRVCIHALILAARPAERAPSRGEDQRRGDRRAGDPLAYSSARTSR